MAKLKTNETPMELLKKHYFWLVVPVLFLIAFMVTMSAKGNIKKKFVAKKTAVEGAKSNTDKIAANKLHPNESTIEAIKGETNILKKSVFEAWTLMYEDQKLRNRWPRQLSKEFLGIVETKKFREPIAPSSTKRYLLEDYSFFIGNHLPELLKKVCRHRCQVQDYRWVKEEKRFFPVYFDEAKNIYYLLITESEESDKIKEVRLYDIKRDILSKVDDSALRATLMGQKKVPYFREVDPWIIAPKDHISYGGGASGGLAGAMGTMGAEMGMAMEGGMGGMGGMEMGMEGGRGGARGSMGGMEGGFEAALAIPGDGVDPAVEQIAGTEDGNAFGAGGMGGGGMAPPMGGAMGGAAGAGASSGIKLPGLPPYMERRKVVGNVDWESPEIYSLPTWSKTGFPQSIEIWYAQESLWVYEAMIRIIEQTNREALDNIAIAPIKRIEALLIGQPAGAAWKTTENAIGDLTGSGASMAMMGSMSGSMESSMESASSASAGGLMSGVAISGSAEKQALLRILFGRYLDEENKPLGADTVPPFAEFNRMPVCMKLVVDQRRIPDLLVNCANCSMPIDIKHVRICPDNAVPFSMPLPAEASGAASSGGGMGGMGSEMGGMGGMGGDPSGARGSMEGSEGMASGGIDVGRSEISQTGGYGVDAIRVEVYGIINIFNAPNITQFGTGGAAAEASNAQLTEETLNATPSVSEAAEEAAGEAADEKQEEDQMDNADAAAGAADAGNAKPAPAKPAAPAGIAKPAPAAGAAPAGNANPAPATPAAPADNAKPAAAMPAAPANNATPAAATPAGNAAP